VGVAFLLVHLTVGGPDRRAGRAFAVAEG
jgi:hypothetical protein